MKLVKNYMKDEALRHGLNELTRKTFGFDFENWVVNGYYEGDYIPYSFEKDGKIISNVSANIMTFEMNGCKKNYIQIGTVMTDETYRNQGLAMRLIKRVIQEYQDVCDGIYLFANLEALEFYRKAGFVEKHEYQYYLKKNVQVLKRKEEDAFSLVSANDLGWKKRYIDYVRNGKMPTALDQLNRYGLQLFYTADLDTVYYSKGLDCFCVLEQDGGTIEVLGVLSKNDISMERVLSAITMNYEELKLGFAPKKEDAHLFVATEYDGADDYRLFCMGDGTMEIEEQKLYFPVLSHA